ncbi:MAG: hypothetical protein CK428_12485 [Mycobacterium sp.]|nr:MAG: hypothetical protein CK428_12485 [Mycobacterium sp.]
MEGWADPTDPAGADPTVPAGAAAATGPVGAAGATGRAGADPTGFGSAVDIPATDRAVAAMGAG